MTTNNATLAELSQTFEGYLYLLDYLSEDQLDMLMGNLNAARELLKRTKYTTYQVLGLPETAEAKEVLISTFVGLLNTETLTKISSQPTVGLNF